MKLQQQASLGLEDKTSDDHHHRQCQVSAIITL